MQDQNSKYSQKFCLSSRGRLLAQSCLSRIHNLVNHSLMIVIWWKTKLVQVYVEGVEFWKLRSEANKYTRQKTVEHIAYQGSRPWYKASRPWQEHKTVHCFSWLEDSSVKTLTLSLKALKDSLVSQMLY